jgi:hypothetical protein
MKRPLILSLRRRLPKGHLVRVRGENNIDHHITHYWQIKMGG